MEILRLQDGRRTLINRTFIAVLLILMCVVGIVTMIVLATGSSPKAFAAYMAGLFIGLAAAALALFLENLRFREQLAATKRNEPVRLPLWPRAITKDEFLQMWGDDPMPR